MKLYAFYHLRWQFSALVMLPFMLLLEKSGLPLWANLMIGQVIGAIIFWKIDKFLFRN